MIKSKAGVVNSRVRIGRLCEVPEDCTQCAVSGFSNMSLTQALIGIMRFYFLNHLSMTAACGCGEIVAAEKPDPFPRQMDLFSILQKS